MAEPWRVLLKGQGHRGDSAWVRLLASYYRNIHGYNVNPDAFEAICLAAGKETALKTLWDRIQQEVPA